MRLLYLLAFITQAMAILPDLSLLKALTDHLGMRRPTLVLNRTTGGVLARDLFSGFHLKKTLKIVFPEEGEDSKHDQGSLLLDYTQQGGQELQDWIANLEGCDPSVVILQSRSRSSDLPATRLDQRLFFYSLEEKVLFERYFVNGVKVENVLANYDAQTASMEKVTGDDFVRRRSDLQGSRLTVLVAEQAPYLTLDPGLKGSKDAAMVTDLNGRGDAFQVIPPGAISGVFADVLRLMQAGLNFTSDLYYRADNVWGGGDGNGSFYGMVGDLHRGHADLFAGSLTLSDTRAAGVTFLHPIGTETFALFIPRIGQ